jgi:hypothetical protein
VDIGFLSLTFPSYSHFLPTRWLPSATVPLLKAEMYHQLLLCGARVTVQHHSHSHQYSETNMMQFLCNLLRIKGLYMFRTLLAHPQEALHKRQLVYCLRVMSVGCTRIETDLQSWGVQTGSKTYLPRTQWLQSVGASRPGLRPTIIFVCDGLQFKCSSYFCDIL